MKPSASQPVVPGAAAAPRRQTLMVIAAALFGVLVGLWMASRPGAAHDDAPRSLHIVPALASGTEGGSDKARMAVLEARLQRLEAEAARPAVSAAPRPEPPVSDLADELSEPPPAPEVAQARFLSLIAERRTQHDSEPLDRAWARRVEPGLSADLARLSATDAGAAFVVDSVQCRTTSCAAQLSFASYQVANDSSALLLHSPYSQRCGTTVFEPEPEDRKAPYTMTMYFECAEARK